MELLVDRHDKNHFAFVRKNDPPVWSPISLFPLLGIGLIASPWTATVVINRKLKLMAQGSSPLLKA